MIETTDGFVAVVDTDPVRWANLDGSEVGQLYVHPSHGGRGVARALHDTVERCAQDRGVDRLTTTASFGAVDVFLRFGFTTIEQHLRFYDGHPFMVAEMVKPLSPPMQAE